MSQPAGRNLLSEEDSLSTDERSVSEILDIDAEKDESSLKEQGSLLTVSMGGTTANESQFPANDGGIDLDARPWWIDFMKEEGLLEDVGSTIFHDDGSIIGDEDQLLPEQNQLEPQKETVGFKPDQDDESLEDDESEEDWIERLWVVARNHCYDDYQGMGNQDDETTAEEEEIALLQVIINDELDQERIIGFRNQLLACIVAYLHVFGDITSPEDGGETKRRSPLRKEAMQMSPFVPLNVARRLFLLVVRFMKDEEESLTDDNIPDDGGDEQLCMFAEHVTQVLFSPELNVFRTYRVEARSRLLSNQDSKGSLLSADGRRIRTDRITDERQRRREIERMLYGDMTSVEEKKEYVNYLDSNEVDPGFPEEEVRIRHGIARHVEKLVAAGDLLSHQSDWAMPFLKQVLLKDFLLDSLNDGPVSISNFVASRVDCRRETGLAYMYSIRYFPHFCLRAAWKTSEAKLVASVPLLMEYFGDKRLIRNRMVTLGIFNGAVIHIRELDSLYEELCNLESLDELRWEEFYLGVHHSLAECLCAVLEDNMRCAHFIPSKTAHGVEWRLADAKNNRSFRIEHDHPQVVSVCLEVGRSCHFQGVTLGKREQDRLSKRLEVDAVLQKRNFNDRMTELEVDSYLEAQSAYQGALKVLKRAELRLKETRSARIQQVDIEEEDDLIGSSLKRDGSDRILDPIEAKAMKHINEARVTIELYLADTLTTLAYCYEAKLSEFLLALKWYNESLVIYTRHVGKDHPTVLHSLQSVGAIYMELKRWKEAERCFVECLALMKRRLPPGSFPKASGDVVAFATPAENKEMAIMLKCLGVVRSELGEYDSAFETISKSIDQMTLVVLQSKAQETHSPPSSALQSPPNDPFICDAQSKLIWSMFCQLSALKSAYTKRRLSMLYSDEKSFDVEGIDVPRLTRLQIERRSIELARQLVKMRRLLLFGEHYEEKIVGTWKKSIRWFDLLDLLSDQLCLGKLLFRRCDYGEAISCWAFALEVMSVTKEGDVPTKMSRAMQRALLECEEKRLDRLSELNYLVGIAHCRVAANDEATAWFEKAIAHLEEKKRILSENGTLNVHNGAEEEKWDILDIDIGVCEHALGLAYYYSNQFSLAAAHFKESLRILEAVASRLRARASIPQGRDDPNMEVMDVALCEYSIRTEFDVCINNVISSVMISLGALYHEQENNARALRFLEGAIKIVYSTTHRVLSSQKISALAIPSVTGFSDISLVLPVIRVGDAHRRIATINLEMENSEEAKLALETAIRCLESTNLESRLSLRIDDETHLESVGQNEVDEMLLSCYELMMTMVDPANPIGEPAQSGTKWWRFLDRRHDRYESFSVNGGLTREDLLFRLGNISAKRGKFDSAIRYLLDARHQMERILGLKDHQMIGNIMFNLGNVYKNIYDAQLKKNDRRAKEKAIESFVESLRIAKSTSGPDSLAAAEVMELLALILMEDESKNPEDWACADDEVARNFLRDAISVRNNCRSDMNLSYARSVHSLGMLALRRQLRCINDGQKHCDDSALDEAVSCLSQAVRIRRILLGDHLDVAASANGLGVAIWLRSISPKAGANASLKDSTKQLQDALFIRTSFLERFCGQNACPLENWKVRVFRKELDGTADIGSVVMQTVEAMYDIARVHESHRSYDEQRQWLEKAMKFLEGWLDKVSGDSSSDERSLATLMAPATKVWKSKLYFGLGISWYFSGDISKAIVDFEKSLKLRGLDSTDMLPPDEVFDNFFLREPGKNPAIQAGSAALAVAATMERLAFAYNKMEKLDSSLSCFSFCLQAYAEQFGHESKEVANILYRMGSIYERRQDLKRCVRALQRVLRIKDRAGEVSSLPCVEDALTYFRLARSLMTLGDFDDAALEHFFSAVRLLEEINLSRQANENATKNTTVNLQSEKVDWQADVSTYNINDLLLEGYSSILTLLRRQNVDSLEHEEIINEVIHNIGNTQAAVHQYQRALQSLESVLRFQKSTKGDKHLSVADLLFNLGNIYVELGQIDRARECHLECHAISKSFLGNDSVELAENIICLGNVEFLSANHLFALEWFDEALRLLKKRKGTNEVAIAKCLHRKALAHDKIGDYDKSIECFGDVLRLGRKLWGMNHMELSNILNSVGTVHRNRGEIKRAMKCYEESLRIRSKLHAELCVANTKNNIGALFISMDRPDHARRFYAEALRIKTEILGPENIETSRSLYNVGQLYVAEKDFRTGLRFFQEALRIFKTDAGDHRREVASCFCSIGAIYDELSDQASAMFYFKKALAEVKGLPTARAVEASALHNIGVILSKRNELGKAIRAFHEAIVIKSTEQESQDISDSQYCLANVLRQTGRIREALNLHKKALALRIHYLGSDHVEVSNSMFGLAQTLIDHGNSRESLNLLNDCIRIRKKEFGDASDPVADATFLLGTVLREVQRLDESLYCLKKALNVKSLSCGGDSAEVADVSFKIAIVLSEMGKYEEAKVYNYQALRIRMAASEDNSLEIASILENMGIIDHKLGDHHVALERMKKVMELRREAYGDDRDTGPIIHVMAQSYFALEKFDTAIKFFDDAVRKKRDMYGSKHIDVARTLVDEGRVFEQIGEYGRALVCYEEAIDSGCHKHDSWELGRLLMRMGVSNFALERMEDAWDCLVEATRVFETIKRMNGTKVEQDLEMSSERDLQDLIKCYECILRLSEADTVRYSIDRSIVIPKIANIFAEVKNYEKASLLYRDAIVLQRSLPGDTRFLVASYLHNLGNCLHHLGDFNEAIECLEDALGLLKDTPGVEGKHIADTYHSLGFVHQTRSDMHEALACYSHAIRSRQDVEYEDNSSIVSTLTNMAEVLRALSIYDASIKSCKDALRLMDAKGDKRLLAISRVVECIGLTHRDRFEYEKALRCLNECLKQRQDAAGMDTILVGKTEYEIARIYHLKGDAESSREHFLKANRVFQIYIGLDNPPKSSESNYADTSLNLLMESISLFLGKAEGDNLVYDTDILISFAATLDYLGKREEAILCYETAINVLLQRVSRDHLSYALAKHELGSIYFRKAKFTDAANMLSDALRIRQLRLGNAHVDTETTLKLLSRSYAASGDSKLALYYFKEVMNARRERSSNTTDSESEIDLLLRLGRLHLQQQEYAEALTCFKDSLRLQRQSVMTCDELKLGETLQCMGSTLIEIKQFHEARLTLLSALRLLGRGGEDSKEVMYVALLLGRVNEEEKSFEKASAWYNRSLAILNNLDNPDEETRARLSFRIGMVKLAEKAYVEALEKVHVAQEAFEGLGSASNLDYAECLNASGRIYNAMKQFDAASNCFQKGLEVRQRQLEATDPDLGDSYHCLGEVLIELQQFEQANSCLSQALGIREENFGIDAQVVGETRRCLGIVEVNLGRLSDANKHFLEAIRIGMRSIESARDMDSDEFDKLMRCFEFVIPMTKDDSNLDMLGKILYQKGTLQSVHKRYRQAMASFTEAVQVFRSMHGEEHLEVANSLFNIGVCLQETEDCDRAMRCFSRALAISRSQLGEDHLEVAETLQHMAEIYRKKEDPKSALSMCEQALHIRRYHEDTALAALLNFSGELYTSVRNGDEAERCFRECVRIRRNLYGDDDMEVSQALYSLGYIHEVFNKDFRRALRCYEESLRIRVTLMENRTEDAARCYLHLGSVHAALGVDSKAFFCFSKAIEMTRQFSNINQKIAEDAIIGQGHALLACGKAVEALVNYERARSQRQERYGVDEKSEDIADMRVFESRALQQLGRNHEALSRLVLALDIYLETVGVNNLGTADTFHCLAELYLKMGQLEDALTCAQQSLIVRKNQLGKLNEAVGESYLVVGKIFFARHDLEKALPCLEAAKEIFQDSNGAQLAVGEAWHYLGCVHESSKNWDRAIGCFQSTLAIRQKAFGRDHLPVAEVLFKLGKCHKRRREFDLATDCLVECLRIQISAKGEDNETVGDTLFELGGTLLQESSLDHGNTDPAQCFVDAIRIYRDSLEDTNSIKIGKCLAKLGLVLSAKKAFQKAGNCYEKAITIFDASLIPNPTREMLNDYDVQCDYEAYAEALLDWARFLDIGGNDGSAIKTYRRALVLMKVINGSDDVIDDTLCRIANILGRQQHAGEAVDLLEQVKNRRIASVGENHSLVADVHLLLAFILEKKRDYPAAIVSLQKCLQIRHTLGDSHSLDVAATLTQIGVNQAHQAEFATAIRTWDEAIVILKKNGVADEDVGILNIKEHQENARHMLESLEGHQ